jgi:hypothetical membrane protein
MNVKIVRLMGKFGFLSPLVGLIMILLSIINNPEWDIRFQTLSDLGRSGFGSVLFNSGLLMTGAIMLLFTNGLFELTKGDNKGQIGSILYFGVSLVICALGVATINIQPIHNYLSITLFGLIPLSMGIFSIFLYERDMRRYAIVSSVCFLISAGIWGVGGKVNAIKEIIAVTALALWQITLAYWMSKQRIPEKDILDQI